VHLHLEAHAAHAHRLAHVFLAVDHELLVEDVQDLLVRGDVHRLRGLDHAVDVELSDLAILDRDHPMRVEALDVAAGDTGVDIADLAVGHQLRFLQRSLDGVHRGFDVHHHTLLQAARGCVSGADHLEHAVRGRFGDDGDDLRRADVEPDDEILRVLALAHHRHALMFCEVHPLFLLSHAFVLPVHLRSRTRTAKPFG
jgi:hypothetical protein